MVSHGPRDAQTREERRSAVMKRMRGENHATPVTKFVHIHDLTASDCLHTV